PPGGSIIQFSAGDPLQMNGGIAGLANPGSNPATYPATTVNRLLMISYYIQPLDAQGNPLPFNAPGAADFRLMRQVNALPPVPVALMYTVNTEQHLQGNDQGNGLAYYGAEAGMEKMMSDLGDFFLNPPQPSPTAAQIQSVACAPNTSCSNAPDPFSMNGTTFSDYEIIVPLAPNGVDPNYQPRTISAGANAGLSATILPLTLRASADRPGGEQMNMDRNVEVALIPVFQFGVLSQSDLSYFAGS